MTREVSLAGVALQLLMCGPCTLGCACAHALRGGGSSAACRRDGRLQLLVLPGIVYSFTHMRLCSSFCLLGLLYQRVETIVLKQKQLS